MSSLLEQFSRFGIEQDEQDEAEGPRPEELYFEEDILDFGEPSTLEPEQGYGRSSWMPVASGQEGVQGPAMGGEKVYEYTMAMPEEATFRPTKLEKAAGERLVESFQRMLQMDYDDQSRHLPYKKMVLGRMYLNQMLCYVARCQGAKKSNPHQQLSPDTLFTIALAVEKYLLALGVSTDVTLCVIHYLHRDPPPGDGRKRTEYIRLLAEKYNVSSREVEAFVISFILGLDYVMLLPTVQIAAELINNRVDTKTIAQAIRRYQEHSPEFERIPLRNKMSKAQFEDYMNNLSGPQLAALGRAWKANGMRTCANTPDGEYHLSPTQLPFLPPLTKQSGDA